MPVFVRQYMYISECRGGWISDEHEIYISMLAVWIHLVPEDIERDVVSCMCHSVALLTCVVLWFQPGGGEDRGFSTRTTVFTRHLLGCSSYLYHNRWLEVKVSFRFILHAVLHIQGVLGK
jgi:hypothetical protein